MRFLSIPFIVLLFPSMFPAYGSKMSFYLLVFMFLSSTFLFLSCSFHSPFISPHFHVILYFQVSAGVMLLIPSRLINLKESPLSERLKHLFFWAAMLHSRCYITGCFRGMCKYTPLRWAGTARLPIYHGENFAFCLADMAHYHTLRETPKCGFVQKQSSAPCWHFNSLPSRCGRSRLPFGTNCLAISPTAQCTDDLHWQSESHLAKHVLTWKRSLLLLSEWFGQPG